MRLRPRVISLNGVLAFSAILFASGFVMREVHGQTKSDAPSTPIPKATGELRDWHTDPTLLSSLADEVTLSKFAVRPPKGYKLSPLQPPLNPGSFARFWVGTPRLGEVTQPHLGVMILIPPASEEKESATDLLQYLQNDIKRNRDNWTQTPVESGSINGLPAVRAYWAGTERKQGVKMQGFGYVVKQPGVFIYLSSQDLDTNAKTALAIAEASSLTLHKQ